MLSTLLLAHEFYFENREFVLNGEKFYIFGAVLNPAYVSYDLWEHHILAAKAMGLNTIVVTLLWSYFEVADGEFDFSSPYQNIERIFKLCVDNDMHIVIRPGPFAGDDGDFGGIPPFLLKDKDIALRQAKGVFKDKVRLWITHVAMAVAKQREEVLMIQLDNMYSMYSPRDDGYLAYVQNEWSYQQGFKNAYISEPEDHLNVSFIPKGVAIGLTGQPGGSEFNRAYEKIQDVPVFASEVHTGYPFDVTDAVRVCPNDVYDLINWYVDNGYSFILGSLCDGAGFDYHAGSNHVNMFAPQVTTRSVSAPLTVEGKTTSNYGRYREILQRKYDEPLIDIPENPELESYGTLKMEHISDLFDVAYDSFVDDEPKSLEDLDFNQGMMIYQTHLPIGSSGSLVFEHIADYAQIYLNKQLISTYNRSVGSEPIKLTSVQHPGLLEVLVDTYGHVNSGDQRDEKGIYGSVTFKGIAIKGWEMRRLAPKKQSDFSTVYNSRSGGVYTATWKSESKKATFLDVSGYKKATIYLNGNMVGRYVEGQLQKRIYCPASFMENENHLYIFDLEESVGPDVVSYTEDIQIGCI